MSSASVWLSRVIRSPASKTSMMTVSILQRGSYLSGGFTVGFQRKPAAPGFEGRTVNGWVI